MAVLRDRRRLALLGLSLAGLVLALYALHRLVDLPRVIAVLREADGGWVAAGAGLSFIAPVLVAWRLHLLVDMSGVPSSAVRAWNAVMAGVTLNLLLPLRGGDAVRAVVLATRREQVPSLFGVVLLERFLDVFTLGLLALLASLGGFSAATVPALGACVAALVVIVVLGAGGRLPVKRELGEQVGRAARVLRGRPGVALASVVLGLGGWVANVSVMVAALRAVGAAGPVVDVFRATPVAILVGVVPVTVGGIGTRDTAMVTLLDHWGMGERVAAAAFVYTLLNFFLQAAVGLLSLGVESLRHIRGEVALLEQERSGEAA